jgi:Raf kinase inhibitor-like YbhB/YbcL family protein
MQQKLMRFLVILTLLVMVVAIGVAAQAPQGGQGGAGRGGGGGAPGGAGGGGGQARGGQRGPALNVTSSAWPDGGEVPQKYAGRGGNTSPAFEFNWMQGTNPAMPPANLASYLVIFHDIENGPRGGEPDTLHWMIWDIPGTAKGLPEGLPMGDLPDGSRQTTTNVGRGQYFGPGAGVGPFHHYVFEFYALDTKLNLPATSTRAQVLAAIDGHVVGKSAFVGRFHATQ